MTWRRTRKVTIQPFDETGAPRRMGQILVDAGLITSEQLETALALQEESPQRKLGSILVEQGYTGEDVIPQVLARQLRLRYIHLREGAFDPRAVALISGRLAAQHACIPVRATKDTLALAMANPLDIIAIEAVEQASGRRVQPIITRESEIAAAIAQWYGPEAETGEDA
jgi:type IV pilus assembly protein PilB